MPDPWHKGMPKPARTPWSHRPRSTFLKSLIATAFLLCFLNGCRSFGPFSGPVWTPPSSRLTLPIWPHRPPDASYFALPEVNRTTPNDELVAGKPVVRLFHVSTPTLTLYTPAAGNTGAAVLVLPGGGFYMLAMDIEGTQVCDWFVARGITCALLKYRVPHAGPYPYHSAGLQDAQRAMSILREYAVEWRIDPTRIGVLGFSAGGHLAAALSTHFDRRLYTPIDAADQFPCRPNFAVLVYPAYLIDPSQGSGPNRDIQPTGNTPPALLIQAEDDPVRVENATTYFLALRQAHVPAEMHIYQHGGHGYGLRPTEAPVNAWPQSMLVWLHTIHML